MRTQSEQFAAAFCVSGGRCVAGRDPLVSLLELQTPSGLVHDLLKTCELPDGWFVLCADGVTTCAERWATASAKARSTEAHPQANNPRPPPAVDTLRAGRMSNEHPTLAELRKNVIAATAMLLAVGLGSMLVASVWSVWP